LNDDDRARVIEACRERSFSRGEVLFHEHDLGDAFHFLVDGHVAVQVLSTSGDVVTLAMLHAPNVFGEQALLEPTGRRTATVVATGPTTTLALHRDRFFALCHEHPSVNGLLVSVLAAQVRRLSDQLVESLHTPAEQRVLRRLRDLAVGYVDGDETTCIVPVTQDDLASMAGTTRPTANRALRTASEEGAVGLRRGRIEVHDVELLATLAGRAPVRSA
jgi:CRP-like cAMP-binding protein